jgi:hypothetical protein
MIRFTVEIQVDADVDGWAAARGISAGAALKEILAFLREVDPAHGQTFLSPVDARAIIRLNAQPNHVAAKLRNGTSDARARTGTGEGMCDRPLYENGQCHRAS